jgi:hypothetical protein
MIKMGKSSQIVESFNNLEETSTGRDFGLTVCETAISGAWTEVLFSPSSETIYSGQAMYIRILQKQ